MSSEWKLSKRLTYVTLMLRNAGFHSIRLSSYRPSPDNSTGWYRIEAEKGQYRVVITEFLSRSTIKKYSYTLLKNDNPLLRYDNAPHHPDHPEVPTFPHHKHVGDEVEPLENPSGLRETKQIVDQRTG